MLMLSNANKAILILSKADGLMLNIFQCRTLSLSSASDASQLLLESGLSKLKAGHAKNVQRRKFHGAIHIDNTCLGDMFGASNCIEENSHAN